MTTQPRKYLSVHSVAARYGCHPCSVWRWVAKGKFPQPVKIGGITRWLEAEVDEHDARTEAQREAVAEVVDACGAHRQLLIERGVPNVH